MKTGNYYRRKILEAAVKGGRGHLGGSFSCVEILMAVHGAMGVGDEFILSKGHAAIALYSILFDDLDSFCQDGSWLTEHPSRLIPRIKVTTGSLGHGMGIAAGVAMAKKLNNEPGQVYVLVGDGECMEGSVYESVMFSVSQQLSNLTIILDSNSVMSTQRLSESIDIGHVFSSMGCRWSYCDGHDLDALRLCFVSPVRYPFRPKIVVAKTVKGKGVSFMENSVQWHNGVPKGAQLAIARKELQ